jgi:shikimate dehydrogenase
VLTGYNTDGEGLVTSLRQEHGFNPVSTHCLVLGAGGAARAVAGSLAAHGASSVRFLNRTSERARSACVHLEGFFPETRFESSSLDGDAFGEVAAHSALIVNCLGAGPEIIVGGFDASLLPDDAIWADINYWMPIQPLLDVCRQRGLRVSNGVGMLVEQGALSFELFTGHPVESAAMAAVIQTETCSEQTPV